MFQVARYWDVKQIFPLIAGQLCLLGVLMDYLGLFKGQCVLPWVSFKNKKHLGKVISINSRKKIGFIGFS